MTRIKVAISSSIIAFKKRKQNTDNPLNAKWKIQMTGLFAVDKNP